MNFRFTFPASIALSLIVILVMHTSCKYDTENSKTQKPTGNYLKGVINYAFVGYYAHEDSIIDTKDPPAMFFELVLINNTKDTLYLVAAEIGMGKDIIRSHIIAVYEQDTIQVYAPRTGRKGCYVNPMDSTDCIFKISDEDFIKKFDSTQFKNYREFALHIAKKAQLKYISDLYDTTFVQTKGSFKIPDSIFVSRPDEFFVLYGEPGVVE